MAIATDTNTLAPRALSGGADSRELFAQGPYDSRSIIVAWIEEHDVPRYPLAIQRRHIFFLV